MDKISFAYFYQPHMTLRRIIPYHLCDRRFYLISYVVPTLAHRKVFKWSFKKMDKHIPEYHCCNNVALSSSSVLNEGYQEAVRALNNLQSNESVLQKIRKEKLKPLGDTNIPAMGKYLARINITQEDLDKLSIIHISGTKGKGSTCAFIESILKEYGYKTGFYSSPHLVIVRERIRINGLPISREGFSYYFWKVYKELLSKKSDPTDMPAYFKFLTILALKIFVEEGVEVAIMEVGIGGEHDCTNVVQRPAVCGISFLDYDHTSYLGTNIESIAWHKAGIMKRGVPTFTVPQEYPNSLNVLFQRAAEKQSPLKIVPYLSDYETGNNPLELGLSGDVQHFNASLALQISHCWLSRKNNIKENFDASEECVAFEINKTDLNALKSVVWPGRSQVLTDGEITYFLDGAHTSSSIRGCISWYKAVSLQYIKFKSEEPFRILFFNVTGDRDPEALLRQLHPLNFNMAIFTTNLATKDVNPTSDQKNYTVSEASQNRRCERMKNIWLQLHKEAHPPPAAAAAPSSPNGPNEGKTEEEEEPLCFTFECISDAVQFFRSSDHRNNRRPRASNTHVLVTGSLHLIGGLISVIDPDLKSLCQQSQNVSLSKMCNKENI